LLEPVVSLEAILAVSEGLCGLLAAQLDATGSGARRIRLSLFGVDGGVRMVELGLAQPVRDPAILLRLLRERLEVTAARFDAEFGFEALRLDALEVAPILTWTGELGGAARRDGSAEAHLLDRLTARLGEERVGWLAVRDEHAPERASRWVTAGGSLAVTPPGDEVMRRPLLLFSHAQPIDVVAMLPDGPPARFTWRRMPHLVVRAEGPERITPNWLRAPHAHARDYFRVEDSEGRRYWLYREGLYGEVGAVRWFLHGLFA
jgi:protein ImuB